MAGKKQAVLSLVSSIGLLGTAFGKLNKEQVDALVTNSEAFLNSAGVLFALLQILVPRPTFGIGVLVPKLIPTLEKLPKIIRPDFESEKK